MLISCDQCHRQYDVTGLAVGKKVRCHCSHLMDVPQQRPHDAKMAHCSSCGGKLSEKDVACAYCGCEVRLDDRGLGDICPECFARLRAGAGYCSECGVRIQPEKLRLLPVDAKCPRCKSGLIQLESETLQYTECSSCGGLWLDEGAFKSIIEKREESTTAIAGIGSSTRPTKLVETHEVRYLPCPSCGKFMNRQNFAGCSGVIIDWCKGCGYWFDRDELARIVEFVKAGGMETARAREAERRRVTEARREAQRAAAQRSLQGAGRDYPLSPRERTGGWEIATFDLGDIIEAIVRKLF